MTMNPLPPQAYTKDTLLKAYSWLQTQTPAIREMAMTPDIMVSLYLKASRDGEQVLERPSIQNFKSELRSLAGLMGELEGPPGTAGANPTPTPAGASFAPPPSAPPPPMPANAKSSFASQPPLQPPSPSLQSLGATNPFYQSAAPSAQDTRSQERPTPGFETPKSEPVPPPANPGPRTETPQPPTRLGLDAKSVEMLREIRGDFNLSTDSEALRMLIKIGYTKAKTLL